MCTKDEGAYSLAALHGPIPLQLLGGLITLWLAEALILERLDLSHVTEILISSRRNQNAN